MRRTYAQLLWIGCADSRVPESVVPNSATGDIFVYRNIAKYVSRFLFVGPALIALSQFHTDDDGALSALDYAIQELKVHHGASFFSLSFPIDSQFVPRTVVVAGHTDCGGVKASYKAAQAGLAAPTTPLERWLAPLIALAEALPPAPSSIDHDHDYAHARARALLTEQNVAAQVASVARALEALQPLERPVRVHGLVYDIVSRKLRNLHVSVTVGEAGATA